MNALGIAIASFMLVFALAARASWKVSRLLRQLKAQEYALWSELSIWQSFLEPGRTILVLDKRFWSRVEAEELLTERKQTLKALGIAYGASAIWGGCILWFGRSGGAA